MKLDKLFWAMYLKIAGGFLAAALSLGSVVLLASAYPIIGFGGLILFILVMLAFAADDCVKWKRK